MIKTNWSPAPRLSSFVTGNHLQVSERTELDSTQSYYHYLEQFWVSKTKPKVITLANDKKHRQSSELIKTRNNNMYRKCLN